jgi:hypothetical protein
MQIALGSAADLRYICVVTLKNPRRSRGLTA